MSQPTSLEIEFHKGMLDIYHLGLPDNKDDDILTPDILNMPSGVIS